MPKITGYHPIMGVRNGLKVHYLELDLDDYYSEDEVKQVLREFIAEAVGEFDV